MVGQSRIEHLLYFFVARQELSDESTVAVVLLHAYSQGSHSPKNHPAFARRENCSCGFLQERQLVSLLAFSTNNCATQTIAVAVEKFCAGVNDYVRSQPARLLVVRGHECVADHRLTILAIAALCH